MTSTPAMRVAARALLLAGAAVVAYLVLSLFGGSARADDGGHGGPVPDPRDAPEVALPSPASGPVPGALTGGTDGRPPADGETAATAARRPGEGSGRHSAGDRGTPDSARGAGSRGDAPDSSRGDGSRGDGVPGGTRGGDGSRGGSDDAGGGPSPVHIGPDGVGGGSDGAGGAVLALATPSRPTLDLPGTGETTPVAGSTDRAASDLGAPERSLSGGLLEGTVESLGAGITGTTGGAVTRPATGVLLSTVAGVTGGSSLAGPVTGLVGAVLGPVVGTVLEPVVIGTHLPVVSVVSAVVGSVAQALPEGAGPPLEEPNAAPAVPTASPDPPAAAPAPPAAAPASVAAATPSAVAPRAAGISAAAIGPRLGEHGSVTKPPQRVAATDAGDRVTTPGPGSGLGGCVPGGCAHTTDAINAPGQPLVLPSVLAVRPNARGLLVVPFAGQVYAGRLPGVAPLPG